MVKLPSGWARAASGSASAANAAARMGSARRRLTASPRGKLCPRYAERAAFGSPRGGRSRGAAAGLGGGGSVGAQARQRLARRLGIEWREGGIERHDLLEVRARLRPPARTLGDQPGVEEQQRIAG